MSRGTVDSRSDKGAEEPAGGAAIPLPADLDTPALVVDAARMDGNIARMAAAGRDAGVELWPHAKTHKCAQVGWRQLEHGAAGLTVATLREAEAFAAAGCADLFIAYPLWAGVPRAGRVRALHEAVRLRVGVDGLPAAERLAASVKGGPPLDVLVEIDCGGHRTGVPAEDAAGLAAGCLRLGLNVLGAFTHPGHAYAAPDAVKPAAHDERAALAVAGEALERVLGRAPVLSGGSTPTVVAGVETPLTEARPGTYVFGDRQQLHLSDLPPGEVALVVAARVVSTPRPGVAVLDAGSKALSSDRPSWLPGHGVLAEDLGATIVAITEEHALVTGFRHDVAVGDLVGVIPNHVCPAVNLGSEILVVSHGVVIDSWPVLTR